MASAAPTGKTVVAGMCYHDPLAAADWLCKAFGFERHRVVTDKKGKITHVEVKFGNGLVMIGPAERSEVSRFFVHPEEIGGAETQSCYVVVDDADAHFVRAKAAGATIVADVGDEEYGGRGYMCRDPEGHLWNFGTYNPWPAQPAALDRSKEQKSAWQIDLKRPAVAAGLAAVLLVVLGTAAWALHNRHVLKRELTNAIPERIAAERETNAIRQVLANERAAKLKTEKLLAAEQRAREKTEQAEAHWRQELQKARDTSVDPASGTGTMTDLHGQLGRERAQVKDLSAKNEALTRAVEQERTAKLTTMAALQKTAADTQRQLEATQAAQKAVEQERAAAQKAAEQAAETQRQLEAARKSADQERAAAKKAAEQAAETRRQLEAAQKGTEQAAETQRRLEAAQKAAEQERAELQRQLASVKNGAGQNAAETQRQLEAAQKAVEQERTAKKAVEAAAADAQKHLDAERRAATEAQRQLDQERRSGKANTLAVDKLRMQLEETEKVAADERNAKAALEQARLAERTQWEKEMDDLSRRHRQELATAEGSSRGDTGAVSAAQTQADQARAAKEAAERAAADAREQLARLQAEQETLRHDAADLQKQLDRELKDKEAIRQSEADAKRKLVDTEKELDDARQKLAARTETPPEPAGAPALKSGVVSPPPGKKKGASPPAAKGPKQQTPKRGGGKRAGADGQQGPEGAAAADVAAAPPPDARGKQGQTKRTGGVGVRSQTQPAGGPEALDLGIPTGPPAAPVPMPDIQR